MQFPASESSANFPALLGEGDGSHIQCRRRNTFLDFARVASRGSPRALTEEPRDTQWRTVYQLQGIAEWRATHLSMHRARSLRRRLLEKRRRERQGKKQRRRDRASEISLGRTGSSKDHCESARLEPVGGAPHVGSVCLESKEIVDQQLLGDATAAVELLAEVRERRREFWGRRVDERVNLLETIWDCWIACAVLGTAAVHDENSDDRLLEQMIRTRTV